MYTLVKKQEKRNKSPIQFHKNYIVIIQGVSLENIRYTKYFTKLSVKIFSASWYSLDPSGISCTKISSKIKFYNFSRWLIIKNNF